MAILKKKKKGIPGNQLRESPGTRRWALVQSASPGPSLVGRSGFKPRQERLWFRNQDYG